VVGSVKLSNIAAVYNMEASNLYNKIWVGTTGAQLTGWQTIVGGSFKVNGIEDSVKFNYDKLDGFCGFRYVQPDKSTIAGQEVVANVPPAKVKLGLSYQFLKMLQGSIFVDYWDATKVAVNTYPYTFTTNVAGAVVQDTELLTVPAWTCVDLNVNVGEFDLEGCKAMVSLYVENVLDTVYYQGNIRATSPIQFLQPPRTVRLKLTMKI
jgi:outer membrane receptor protein involved in Fe transport